jgi:Fe/S biogenesis protein NfuA
MNPHMCPPLDLPMASDPPVPEPPLAITDTALEKVLGFRAAADPPGQAMWVEVTGVQAGEWAYTMYLKPLEEAGPRDSVQRWGELDIVVPADGIDKVRGATIEWSGDLLEGGLRLLNPNTPSPRIAPGGGDLSGPVPQRVAQVLDDQVNPSIAAHGGRADLVGVEDRTAYLRLSGGCQGCGMAQVTLSQGIEVAITEAVPEIAQVVDVTDHQSGENPYFEAAKK